MSMQTVTLTQTTYSVAPVAHAVQNDTGRKLLMILGDVTVASGWTAELAFARPNNTYYSVSASIDLTNNGFRANITQALTQAGTVRAQLKVTSTDGIVSTYTFIIEVQPDAKGVATPEASYTLEEAYRLAEESQDIAEEATAAAAAALDDIENLAPAIRVQEELVQTDNGVTLEDAAAGRDFEELKFYIPQLRAGSGHATPTNIRHIQELDSVTLNLNGTTKTYSPRVSSQGSTNVRPVPPCSFDFVRKYFVSSVHFAYLLANYDSSNISGSVDAGTGLFVAHIKIETSYKPDGNNFLSPVMEYKASGTLGEYEYSYEGYTAASGSTPAYITFAVSVPGVTTVAEFNNWAGEVVTANASSARVYFSSTDRQTVTVEDPNFTTALGDNALSATCTLRNVGSTSTQTQKPGRFVVKYTKDTTLYTSEIIGDVTELTEAVTRNTQNISEIGDDVQEIQNRNAETIAEVKEDELVNAQWESGGIQLDGAWAGQRMNQSTNIRLKTSTQLTSGTYIVVSHGQYMTVCGYNSATVHDRTTYTGEIGDRWTKGTIVVTVPANTYALITTRLDRVTDFTPEQNALEIYSYEQVLDNALNLETLEENVDLIADIPQSYRLSSRMGIIDLGDPTDISTSPITADCIKKAFRYGFRSIRINVRCTSDLVPVLSHDATITINGTTYTIASTPYATVSAALMSLSDAMLLIKRLGMDAVIELKDSPTNAELDAMYTAIAKWSMAHNVRWSSWNVSELQYIRSLQTDANISLICRMGTAAVTTGAALVGAGETFLHGINPRTDQDATEHPSDWSDAVLEAAAKAGLKISFGSAWSEDELLEWVDKVYEAEVAYVRFPYKTLVSRYVHA